MIKINNLYVKLGTFVLDIDSLEIPKNKITFIKGKNGSGKTTLLKSISGLISTDANIALDGVVTYLSQEPVLFHRTVLENILYPIMIRKWDKNKYMDEIKRLSELFDITHLLGNNAKELSAGEKMKVALIRSVIFQPDYVFLDEPTTHLDVESIDALTRLIKQYQQTCTFVIVSHNSKFIETLEEHSITLGG